VAGSVRAPAHFSGIYSLRCSTGRWPKSGLSTSMAGQEGVPAVASPMTRTLDDLVYFSRAILNTRAWELDHTVHPIPWREASYVDVKNSKTLRIGVMRTDTVIDPSPACSRALSQSVTALKAAGHDVFDVTPPDTYEALVLASVLLNTDGCETFRSFFRTGETNDRGAAQMSFWANLPSPIRYIYYLYVRYIRRDPIWAGLLRHFGAKSSAETWKWVAKREAYRARFHAWWNEQSLDFLLTPPNATPAVPHGGMHDAVSSCGYTFLFNLVDYPAGIVPVTKVDAKLDALSPGFRLAGLNGVARGAYKHYDAKKMAGLPVAVQVVGPRLQEERVLAAMELLESALEKEGGKYQLLEVE
jgi:Asp-tRNA(Asn)/Glu-tRNA(Gln) amidotransferase A subunit family amidase